MTKFLVLSDIHLDHYYSVVGRNKTELIFNEYLKNVKDIDERILICAGDISSSLDGWINCKFIFDKFKHVILTLGNHDMVRVNDKDSKLIKDLDYKDFINCEYTTENKIALIKKYVKDNCPNVTILDCDVIEYEGIKIGGTFGWYDWVDDESPLDEIEWKNWYDGRLWRYYNQNLRTIAYNEVKKMKKVLDEKPDIFITHVAHALCNTNPIYKTSNENKFFYYTPNEYELEGCKYIICGHTHSSVLRKEGNQTIMCNPMGYYDEKNPLELHNLKLEDFMFEM